MLASAGPLLREPCFLRISQSFFFFWLSFAQLRVFTSVLNSNDQNWTDVILKGLTWLEMGYVGR